MVSKWRFSPFISIIRFSGLLRLRVSGTDPPPLAAVTQVDDLFDPDNRGQTVTIIPNDWIGSADVDVNYRVALRGGEDGILVWQASPVGDPEPIQVPGFDELRVDGSYYWTFTTGTEAA